MAVRACTLGALPGASVQSPVQVEQIDINRMNVDSRVRIAVCPVSVVCGNCAVCALIVVCIICVSWGLHATVCVVCAVSM